MDKITSFIQQLEELQEQFVVNPIITNVETNVYFRSNLCGQKKLLEQMIQLGEEAGILSVDRKNDQYIFSLDIDKFNEIIDPSEIIEASSTLTQQKNLVYTSYKAEKENLQFVAGEFIFKDALLESTKNKQAWSKKRHREYER